MIFATRFRLIVSFLGVSVLVGGLSLLAGGGLIYRAVLSEANSRVSLDLNAARDILQNRENAALLGFSVLEEEGAMRAALKAGDTRFLAAQVTRLATRLELDFAGVVAADGAVLARTGGATERPAAGGTGPDAGAEEINPAVSLAFRSRAPVSGVAVLSEGELAAEGAAIARRARIAVVPTPRSMPRAGTDETAGLALAVAVPSFDGYGAVSGVLYGGILLNHNEDIVDRIRDTVFRQETYKAREIGTATIFLKDLRVATNVRAAGGERAIGTQASAEVARAVLAEGRRWTGRAFVVNDWYVTAYEPLEDVRGQRVGMLYVGVLEGKYSDIRRSTMLVFVAITLGGMAIAIVLGSLMGYRLLKPIQRLIAASRTVSRGDLTPDLGPISRTEIGILQSTFQEMLGTLRERDRLQKAERDSQLIQSEKQASVGRLAAGIAHEINNPLTGVLTFTHLLLRRKDLDEGARTDLQTIARSTERVRGIVKGLLDFSRQTRMAPEPMDVNKLIVDTMALAGNQALVKGIHFCLDLAQDLPPRILDRSHMQSVILNIVLNAIDATEPGGHIDISTSVGLSTEGTGKKGIEIQITDSGCGIPEENLDKIFDPFFTTKEVGKGTGLGLAVSLGIMQQHGGTIRVRSRTGQGSTFILWLPLPDHGEGA